MGKTIRAAATASSKRSTGPVAHESGRQDRHDGLGEEHTHRDGAAGSGVGADGSLIGAAF